MAKSFLESFLEQSVGPVYEDLKNRTINAKVRQSGAPAFLKDDLAGLEALGGMGIDTAKGIYQGYKQEPGSNPYARLLAAIVKPQIESTKPIVQDALRGEYSSAAGGALGAGMMLLGDGIKGVRPSGLESVLHNRINNRQTLYRRSGVNTVLDNLSKGEISPTTLSDRVGVSTSRTPAVKNFEHKGVMYELDPKKIDTPLSSHNDHPATGKTDVVVGSKGAYSTPFEFEERSNKALPLSSIKQIIINSNSRAIRENPAAITAVQSSAKKAKIPVLIEKNKDIKARRVLSANTGESTAEALERARKFVEDAKKRN